MFLYHYFDKSKGPFKNLSALSIMDGVILQNDLIEKKTETYAFFASQRKHGYIERRKELEKIALKMFIQKEGKPKSTFPHYFTVEECKWLESWYPEPNYIKIKVDYLNTDEISFSYGDLFPTFSDGIDDKKEYRKNIYTYNEIKEVIKNYGFPQDWNPYRKYAPEAYVEAHFWNEDITIILEKGIYKEKNMGNLHITRL
jgi:hypothetical protein